MADQRLSIIVPAYNERESIPVLADEIRAVYGDAPGVELLLVDDGSTDGTWEAIRAAAERHPFVRGLRSPVNQGQSAALLAGFRHARGEILVLLDGDLQNNPKDIPAVVEKLATCDVVCGYRANRKDTWSRRAGSRVGNVVRNWFTRDGLRDIGCTLKAFRRACVDDLPPLNGVHRFLPAYFKLHGRRIEEIAVDHRPRRFGRSNYTNLRRLPRTLFDLFGFVWYRRRRLTRLADYGGATEDRR